MAKAAGRTIEAPDSGPGGSKSARSRQRILDSAARVFRHHGNSARLCDIAAEAGMQTGSLYYHFDSRDALVEEVLRLGVERTWDHVRAALDEISLQSSAGCRLETAVRAHAVAVLDQGDYTAANSRIFALAPTEVRQRHYSYQKAYGDYFHQLIVAAVDSGELRPGIDPAVVRMLLFGAMNWTVEWYRPDSGRAPGQVIDELVAMVFEGLWAPPASAD
jgi:TetR/AcrR family transcriptional regulator, cholesterol catabolism regulator